MPGWKVHTLGDDIAWLHFDDEGCLRAINPESGYFGVVPGTNEETNKNAYDMITHDTIFTNVARTVDNNPWWEGKSEGEPEECRLQRQGTCEFPGAARSGIRRCL